MKYGTVNFGQVEAAINKLGGLDVFERLLTYNLVTVTFRDGKVEIVAIDPVTSIWKSITIGNIPRDQLGTTITERGMNVGKWAVDMMTQKAFVVSTTTQEHVALVRRSPAELGFTDVARYHAICARGIEIGLELCQPEDGPQLRLQYPDQPKGEWLIMAMKAIRDSGGSLGVFGVGRDGRGRYLSSDSGGPDRLFDPDSLFVFRASKPLAV